MRTVLSLLRMLCYVALAVVGGAALALTLNETFAICTGFSANTGLACGGAWYEGLFNFAMGIVMVSLLSLVPAALAIAGLIFAVIDLVRWRRRRAAAAA
ncbi:MAG: hypothetical protein ACK4UO_03160 [Pseudolabrys sp.]